MTHPACEDCAHSKSIAIHRETRAYLARSAAGLLKTVRDARPVLDRDRLPPRRDQARRQPWEHGDVNPPNHSPHTER
jgi:hypothetical protein